MSGKEKVRWLLAPYPGLNHHGCPEMFANAAEQAVISSQLLETISQLG